MPTINVTVRNRIATAQRWQCIICGNSDYIVDFDLDDEWNDMPNKVAVFVTNTRGNIRHERVLFDGSTCGIPVLRGVNMVDIGIEAGDIRTTTPAHVKCEACITDRAGMPQEPENNVYGQILAMTADIAQAVIAASEQAESAQTAASAAARDAQTTRTAASAAASSAQTAQECAQAMWLGRLTSPVICGIEWLRSYPSSRMITCCISSWIPRLPKEKMGERWNESFSCEGVFRNAGKKREVLRCREANTKGSV